jgi:hypothetical protein
MYMNNLIFAEQHGFVKGRSTVSNLVENSCFVLNAFEDGCQVYSVYTDFSKAFDRFQHCLVLHKMSANIEPARCLLLGSYLGRTQCIRIGDW